MEAIFWPPDPVPDGAVPITEANLAILVGLSGVGKSSLIAGLGLPALPDRREIVDRLISLEFGMAPPREREGRFAITRRYREIHPGGVAFGLFSAWVMPQPILLFDGLRGAEESQFALDHYPKARFLVLEAPPELRVRRIAGRGDSFDQISPGDLSRAQAIVREEEENYSSLGAREALWGQPRALFLDTATLSLAQEITLAQEFLNG